MDGDLCNLKGVKSFAILGGTFDPVHNGHISVAKEILKNTDVERILLIPSGVPPHKKAEEVTKAKIRMEMLNVALENEENMVISSIEIERKGLTYTVDTIAQLKEKLGEGVKFKFILGADALDYISSWKDYKRVLKMCSFIAVARPGYDKDALIKRISSMENSMDCHIEFVSVTPVDISSSQIREWVREDKNINDLVPIEVAKYIEINGLYK